MESEGETNKQSEREGTVKQKKPRTMCSSCVTHRERKNSRTFSLLNVCVRVCVSCIVVFISFCSSAISSALFIAIVVVSGRVTAPLVLGQ